MVERREGQKQREAGQIRKKITIWVTVGAIAMGGAVFGVSKMLKKPNVAPITEPAATPTPSAAAGTPTPPDQLAMVPWPGPMPEARLKPTPSPSKAVGTPRPPEPTLATRVEPTPVPTKTPAPAPKPPTTPEAKPKPTPAPTAAPETKPATTTTAPAKTPEPTKTSEAKSENYTYKRLPKGDVWFAEPGDIAVGDLEANDEALYDQEEKTGHITILPKGAKITAVKNAGEVIHPLPGANTQAIIEEIKQEMLKTGCVNGCKEVIVKTFPSIPQAQTEKSAGIPVPAKTPEPTVTPKPPEANENKEFTFRHLNPGELADVGRNQFVVNNVSVVIDQRQQPAFSSGQEEGLILDIQSSGTIIAPQGGRGAEIITVLNAEKNKTGLIERAKQQEMKRSGLNRVNVAILTDDSLSINMDNDPLGISSLIVKGNAVIVGDVEINGQRKHDDDPGTGLIVFVSKDIREATVTARFGANIQVLRSLDPNKALTILDREKQKMEQGGKRVSTISLPAERQTQGQPEMPVILPLEPIGTPISFLPEEIGHVSPDTVVSGDIIVDGKKHDLDLNPRTALVWQFEKGAVIEAPFGASGRTNLKDRLSMEKATNQMIRQTFKANPNIDNVLIRRLTKNGQIEFVELVTR